MTHSRRGTIGSRRPCWRPRTAIITSRSEPESFVVEELQPRLLLSGTDFTSDDWLFQPHGGHSAPQGVPTPHEPHVEQSSSDNFSSTISGTKFEDLDADSVRDSGEPGLAGWTIFLDLNRNGLLDDEDLATQTDSQGRYQFDGLNGGQFLVREVLQENWRQTAPESGFHDVTLVAGSSLEDIDFGNTRIGVTGLISGLKFEDLDGDGSRDPGEPGLAGWTIFLDLNRNGMLDDEDLSDVTDEEGNYSFTGLQPGEFIVREVLQPNFHQTAPASGFHTVLLTSGSTITDRDFGNMRIAVTGSISGLKFEDLDGDGSRDPGEPGLAGWTIFLDLNRNGMLDDEDLSDVTDEAGNYSFTGLQPGEFIVREVLQPNFHQTAPASGFHTVLLASGSTITDRDFGNTQDAGSISGILYQDINGDGIRQPGEPGLPGWIIYVDTNRNGIFDNQDLLTITRSDGMYLFDGLQPGEFEIREVMQPGWDQSAPIAGFHQVTLAGGLALTDLDFGNFSLFVLPPPPSPTENPAPPLGGAPSAPAPVQLLEGRFAQGAAARFRAGGVTPPESDVRGREEEPPTVTEEFRLRPVAPPYRVGEEEVDILLERIIDADEPRLIGMAEGDEPVVRRETAPPKVAAVGAPAVKVDVPPASEKPWWPMAAAVAAGSSIAAVVSYVVWHFLPWRSSRP